MWVSWAAWLALPLAGMACSGRTERGVTNETVPAEKPAAGPGRPDSTPTGGARDPRQHLLMVVELEPGVHAGRILTARSVDLPLPRRRATPRQEPWRVDVLDAAGSVLFTATLADASQLRGEFADAQGELSGVTVRQPKTAVTLRLPLLPDAVSVRLSSDQGSGRQTELGRVNYPQVAP